MSNKKAIASGKDRKLCLLYLEALKRQGAPAHEPWEHDLEAWAANPQRSPRSSTINKLRLRFPED